MCFRRVVLLIQPFQGWRFGWVGWTQGSFVGNEITLGWMMERRWRSWSARRVTPLHGAPTFTVLCHCTTLRLSTIPTGLNQPAQGCEERATLGIAPTTRINPERVESIGQPTTGTRATAGLNQSHTYRSSNSIS